MACSTITTEKPHETGTIQYWYTTGSRTILSLKVLKTLYGESPESLNIVWEIEDLLATPGCAHEVNPGDKVVALIRLRPNREYFAENDAAVVPKNSRAYKPWVKAIKRNVAKTSL